MQALVKSWSATPETKATLDDMRVNDKPRWHALVRQCRITKNPEEVGVPDLQARKKAVVEATASMKQGFGVRDSTEVLW